MATGRPRRVTCRVCQMTFDDPSVLSKRGKCPACAEWLINENLRQLEAHDGPFFRHWRGKLAASVGGRLLDESAASE